jgi:hypothetical protein
MNQSVWILWEEMIDGSYRFLYVANNLKTAWNSLKIYCGDTGQYWDCNENSLVGNIRLKGRNNNGTVYVATNNQIHNDNEV